MRILVTGKNSQLGRSIHKMISQDSFDEFIFIGREELDFSSDRNISHYFNHNVKFDIIINCAAYTQVDKAEQEVELANQINHLAVKKLAEIANLQQAKLIHVSTDYVFDGKSDKPYTESDIASPINEYGRTKLAGEIALQKIMLMNAIIIRTSWLYSEYGNNFVKTILKISSSKKQISVVSDQTGSPTFATDLATAILEIINDKGFRKISHMTQIYHYSNIGAISWYEFAQEIFKIAKIDCQVNPIKTKQSLLKAKRPRNSLMSKNKIRSVYNVQTPFWKTSFKNFI
jgi:dTDP-4-dehydrorhamnose reductase